MSFTLSHVILGANRAPELLTSETAAYIVLSLAEQIMGAPREVTSDNVLLHASGALVVADVPQCSAQVSDECLRELLATLLESVSVATVSDAVRHVALGDAKGPVALRSELHSALVPLNRAAARRALMRLHRKLSALFADSAVAMTESGSGLSRRGRRRAALEPAGRSDDIQVTLELDESRSHATASKPAVVEDGRAFWHPAQTTPWQFNEAARASGDGTPIFGSLAVQDRPVEVGARRDASNVYAAEQNTTQWQPGREEQTEAEAPVALRHQSEHRPSRGVPLVVEHDTQIDHPVVAKTGLAPAHLRRVSPRRSRVSDLVQRFAATRNESPERAVAELYQMASEGEFAALGTATPPPVARESYLPASPVVKHKPRRIVLKAAMALCPVVAYWLMQPPEAAVESRAPTSAAATTTCLATVRVSVPSHARVFLNDQQERQEQSGPIAVFSKVPCSGQAEVTVRVPEPSGSPLPDAWVRVPLPEADLQRAAALGRALDVAPLGP